jgi:hypothetical protein
MKRINPKVLVGILTLLGFAFRLCLAYGVPQALIYDQYQYYGYAIGMLAHGIWGDTVRLYGYPLIILPIVKYFGVAIPTPWILLQTVMDLLTAIMVFLVTQHLFARKSVAWISFIIYLFNPYTSAFVNVMLTEISAIFMVMAVMWLIFVFLNHHKAGLLLFAALILGFLPQVRPSFIYWSLVITGVLFWLVIQSKSSVKSKLFTFGLIAVMYFLPYSYTVASNLILYHQFALQSVDNIFWREVYISNYIGRGIPFAGNPEWDWPPQAYAAWYEYSTPTTPAGRAAMAQKYEQLSFDFVRTDTSNFIINHIFKLWYVWEKHFLYPYQIGPDSPQIRFAVYWGNVVLLLAGWSGAVIFTVRQKLKTDRNRLIFGILSIFLFAYISIAHVFSTSEERFSLPAYPVVAIFAGYSVVLLRLWLKKSMNRRHG